MVVSRYNSEAGQTDSKQHASEAVPQSSPVKMADATNTLPSTDNTSLTCAARVLGYECADPNLAFLRCKQDNADPRACLPQGEKVTACVLKT